MAALHQYRITVDAVALAAATAKTVLELATPSTRQAKIRRWWVNFDGVSASAVPGRVQLLRKTATITGTALTPRPKDPGIPAALCTAKHTATAEGTDGNIDEEHRVPPTSGYDYTYALGEEPILQVSEFIAIKCTFAAAVNVTAGIEFEE